MVRVIQDFSFQKYKPRDIQRFLDTGDEIILRFDNTKELDDNKIFLMKRFRGNDRLKIRVEGGYKGKEVYVEGKDVQNYFTFKADTYSISELSRIIPELERIEKGINPEWDDLQKVLYFIGELKNNIVYNPLVIMDAKKTHFKEDQSLKSIVTGVGVCASYALILKELCDRNNIECDLVFGATTLENSKKGYTSHAWNIVTINGKKIPIDSTWNAQRYNDGSSLDFASSANVNNFVKHHFPGKYEKIKDYKKELVSIDGRILRMMNSFINKDVKYRSNIFKSTRKDGSKFQITQLEDRLIDNNHLYRYLYRKQYPDGTFGLPIVLYSSFNIAKVVRNISRNKNVSNNQILNNIFDNILFSRQNIKRVIDDKTFYLGDIDNRQVLIDLNIGKKINSKQRSFKRKDGSKICIEEWSGFSGINRYLVYEYIIHDKKIKVSKNTVFTEMDLMTLSEDDLDLLLEKNRIERKSKETNGYLGKVSNGYIYSDPKLIQYFRSELPNKLKVKDNYFIDYFKEITFEDMKILVKTYNRKIENGEKRFFNRVTGRELKDEELCLKASFAYIWLSAAGTKWSFDEKIPGYEYAFNEASERIFDNVSELINNSVVKNGNINPVNIFIEAEKSKYKYALEIVAKLFSTNKNISVINELFKKQNPSSVSKKKQSIKGFDDDKAGMYALENAYELAEEEKERRKRELDNIFEVISTNDGQLTAQKKYN